MIQTFKTKLTLKKELAPKVLLLEFALLEPAEVEFLAGQYMIMFVPQADGEEARRLYSVASPSTQKASFDLLLKLIPGGVASVFAEKLQIGEEVKFDGPAGRFVMKENERNKVFLATGTGLAPMLSMLRTYLPTTYHLQPTYHLRWGLGNFTDIYYLEDFKQLAQKYPQFSFQICISREQSLDAIPEADRKYFTLGRITANFTAEPTNTDYYICGGRDMVESTKNFLLVDHKLPPTAVSFEKF